MLFHIHATAGRTTAIKMQFVNPAQIDSTGAGADGALLEMEFLAQETHVPSRLVRANQVAFLQEILTTVCAHLALT